VDGFSEQGIVSATIPGMTTYDDPVPVPPADTATDPIRSAADLGERWRALVGPLGFGERLLQFVFVGPDRRMVKVLSEFRVTATPDPRLITNLMEILRKLLATSEPGSTVALLLTRPGRGGITETDRQWSTLLTATAADLGVPIEPVFRADDEHVVLVEPG
jgi:hypothetical protein